MKNLIQKLPIKFKLLFAFGSILLMSVWLISVGITSIRTIINYNQLAEQIDEINISSLEMAQAIQQFTQRGFKETSFLKNQESAWLRKYELNLNSIHQEFNSIRDHKFFKSKSNMLRFDSLQNELEQYQNTVNKLMNTYYERGFQDYGVEGKLRRAIHDVEDSDFAYDKVTMLMLRRHEKDFFLRKDLKYLDRFNNLISEFKLQIDSSHSLFGKEKILTNISNYKSQFNYIVELEQRIGLTFTSGMLGNLNKTFESLDKTLDGLTSAVKIENDQIVRNSMITLFILLAIQIVLGLILVIFYAKLLTKAINEIKSALVSLSKGSFPNQLSIKTKDEIADAKTALNNLVDRIRSAVDFAQNLGKGNLTIKYDEKFNDDVLAKAIIQMKDQLVEADTQQKLVNWSNKGLAKFNEILKNELDDIEILGDRILSQLVEYLSANQGAIYILNDDEMTLARICTYAYGKKKYVNNEIQVGQGLVGQCVLEKQYIHLTEIPNDYVKITSGLGEAAATNLLITPLMINEKVNGVIELASFSAFEEHKIEFVNKVSESIANILNNKTISQQTLKLLVEAQERASLLSSHEEELRQNTEELQATQEETERQRDELLNKIKQLEQELRIKEKETKALISNIKSDKKPIRKEYA